MPLFLANLRVRWILQSQFICLVTQARVMRPLLDRR